MIKVNADMDNNPDLTNGCWPTPHQELLLRAALLDKDPALAAWTQWRREVDVEESHLDMDSFRLLPLVYHNLKQYAVDDPFMGRLKGIHRRAWVENEMQLKAGVDVVREFHTAGIAPLLLKNVPLTFCRYPVHGTRPLGDWDLLVSRTQIQNATAILDTLAWQPVGLSLSQLTDSYFAVRHVQLFSQGEGRRLALHWRMLPDDIDGAADPLFMDGAVSLIIGDLSARALNTTDLLLYTCVQGISWAALPSARWVADVYLLLTGAQIDWDRLIRMAEITHTSLSLRMALSYLQRTFAAPIAPEVLPALERIAVSSWERDLFAAQSQRSHFSSRLSLLWLRYRHHQAQARQQISFAGYLRAYYGHQSFGESAAWALSKATQRITKQWKRRDPR
jgi:hypothetical protein